MYLIRRQGITRSSVQVEADKAKLFLQLVQALEQRYAALKGIRECAAALRAGYGYDEDVTGQSQWARGDRAWEGDFAQVMTRHAARLKAAIAIMEAALPQQTVVTL